MTEVIEFWWSRHGLSCHNAIKKYDSGPYQVVRIFATDPPLTNWAMRTFAAEAPVRQFEKNWKIDGKMASVLLRAQQTADMCYPAALARVPKVVIAPYISEQGWTGENWASSKREQAKIHALYGTGNVMDYSFVTKKLAKAKPSYSKFLRWFNANKEALFETMQIDPKQKVVRIAVVSHSHTIKKFLMSETEEEKSKEKIRHFGTVRASFKWNGVALEQDFCPVVKSFSKSSGSKCDGFVFAGYPMPPKKLMEATDGRASCPW